MSTLSARGARSIAPPLLLALLCSPILLLTARWWAQWTLLNLVVRAGLYGAVYSVLCVFFVMDQLERNRFGRAALRRLPIAANKRPGADPGGS